MKKIVPLLALTLVLLCSYAPVAKAATPTAWIAVAFNDTLLSFPDVQPEVRQGTTYLPVRPLAEAMRTTLNWQPDDNIILLTKGTKKLTLDLTTRHMRNTEGTRIPLDIYLKNGRTMIPIRQISEYFGYHLSYNAQGPIARITDTSATLTDEQLYQKYASQIAQEKTKYQPLPPPDTEVFLTFDDGPNLYTSRILDVLVNEHVHATFFMLGPQIEKYPQVVKRMQTEGHSLGLHGVTHDAQKVYASPRSLVNEMESANASLTQATGYRTSIMRVPYGSKPYMTESYRNATVNAGYHMWDWNVDSCDSCALDVPATKIIAEVKSQVQGKKRAVVLMHDRKTTLEALPTIIHWLKGQGYTFSRIYGSTPPHNFWNDLR